MKQLFQILAGLTVFTLAGCSSYDQRFAEAARAGATGDAFAGAYSGRWNSSRHPGGGGQLRCILTAVDSPGNHAPRNYRADFHATWHGFSSEHSVVLQSKPSPQGKKTRNFTGTSALRTIIGSGTYQCEGTVDGKRMRANYDATYDKGTFEMSRMAGGGGISESH